MKRALRTAVRLFVLLCVLSSVLLLLLFPSRYPEQTLVLEEKIRSALDAVTLPIKLSRLALQPVDIDVLMPVYGKRVNTVADTWEAPRDGGERSHEGQDMFAARGTPVFSATNGYVRRVRTTGIGGNSVLVTGAGGRRYYYAHFDRFAEGIHAGQWVTTDTVLGFVGSTGNAVTTPPHLHFGIYEGRQALNPLPFLKDRP